MAKIIKDISVAINELKSGNVVALPTETVYGLGANALNPNAVLKIFEAKKRPHFDPLIVHIPDISLMEKYTKNIPRDFYKLAEVFSPGPITFVLNKKKIIPDLVTSGLNTVAVRIPSHPIIRIILSKIDFPIAAPSANKFGRISPTSAQDVKNELDAQIKYIIDGGKSEFGIESTIVRNVDGKIFILRPGFITKEQIENVLNKRVFVAIESPTRTVHSPGMLKFHYAPRTPLFLIKPDFDFNSLKNKNYGYLKFKDRTDLKYIASNLFQKLRLLDRKNFDFIVSQKVSNSGIGYAINDRLVKSSSGNLYLQKGKLKFERK
jgi:L-threonylcarbamoyladenylate synthase